jgi:hypothetical protein
MFILDNTFNLKLPSIFASKQAPPFPELNRAGFANSPAQSILAAAKISGFSLKYLGVSNSASAKSTYPTGWEAKQEACGI